MRDSASQDLPGRQAGDDLAAEPDLPTAQPQEPADRCQQRRLAGTVGSDDAGDPAFGNVDRDLLEDVAAAVAGDHAVDAQQRLGTAEPLGGLDHRRGDADPGRVGRLAGTRCNQPLLRGLVVLATEIRVEHRGIRAHGLRGAGHERGALAENRDLVAQVHHELHVVLDDEERLAGSVELGDPLGEVLDERRIDTAGGLVEQ